MIPVKTTPTNDQKSTDKSIHFLIVVFFVVAAYIFTFDIYIRIVLVCYAIIELVWNIIIPYNKGKTNDEIILTGLFTDKKSEDNHKSGV
jgi:hypothetical protein